jgi:rhamnosyltransferase subunit B
LTGLLPLSEYLLSHGHNVELAVRDLGALPQTLPTNIRVWQAPVWPGSPEKRSGTERQPNSLADVLVLSGLSDNAAFGAMLTAWDSMIAQVKPDRIIAEYSPALITAAHGKVETVAIGTGFTTPPLGVDAFRNLDGRLGWANKERVIDCVNTTLFQQYGRCISSITELFDADHCWPATLPSLDPYRFERNSHTYASPLSPSDLSNIPTATGNQVFIYSHNTVLGTNGWWKAIAATRLPVRVHMRHPTVEHLSMFQEFGFAFEPDPIPLKQIISKSRLILSHGGHGLTCAGLILGLPHMISGYDSEKLWNGYAVQNLGCGIVFDMTTERATQMAERLMHLYHNEEVQRQAILLGRCLRASPSPSYTRLIEMLDSR